MGQAMQASVLFGVGALIIALIWFLAKAIAGHWIAHKIFATVTKRRKEKKNGNKIGRNE